MNELMLQTQIRKLLNTSIPAVKIADQLHVSNHAIYDRQLSEEIFILDASVTDLQEDIIGYISVSEVKRHRQPLI